MPRKTNRSYSITALEELTRGLLFTPTDRRPEQVRRAEQLHDDIDPQTLYPLEFVTYRITNFRATADSDPAPNMLIGEAIRPDLRQLIDELSRSTTLPPEPHETYHFSSQLAHRFDVSTKTIERWRSRGLRWRWIPNPKTGRRVVAYPASAVERFVADHPDLVAHAASYHHTDLATKNALVARAAKLSAARNITPQHLIDHLAKRTRLSPATVRRTLEKNAADLPNLFPLHTGPLSDREKNLIERAARRAIPHAQIARRIRRTRSTVTRAINLKHAARVRHLNLHHHSLPVFDTDITESDRDEMILGKAPPPASPPIHTDASLNDIPPALRPFYLGPTLAPDATRTLFVRMHYRLHRASLTRDRLDKQNPRLAPLKQIEHDHQIAIQLRSRIATEHLPHIVTAARQHRIGSIKNIANIRLSALLLLGNDVLFNAVDTFELRHRRPFQNYLTYLLQRRFAQLPTTTAHRRQDDHTLVDTLHQNARAANIDLTLPLALTPNRKSGFLAADERR